MTEPCEECGQETLHQVEVELRTESSKRENAEYSREPYRVATCIQCGVTSAQRMNDA
jgi:predicted nucleic-acid-binding Zn-ribbon protein